MKLVKNQVTTYEYTHTMTEEQALILCKVLGNIRGRSKWRTEYTDVLHDELRSMIGQEKYDDFSDRCRVMDCLVFWEE